MSDTINLAGKDLIVNSVSSMQDRSAYSLSSTKSALAIGNTKQSLDAAKVDISKNGTSLARVGARVNPNNGKKIFVYCYNPREAYSDNFGDAYYVNTGFVNCNGLSYPVYINGNYTEFNLATITSDGTWAIVIKKISGSSVWTVDVLCPSPDQNNVMVWSNISGQAASIDTNTWVIGSFVFSSSSGISQLYVNTEALTPTSFLNNRFLQIMGEAPGSDTDDFTSWAIAMNCDAIFKRIAALELFVANLKARNLEVGTYGTGFSFRALSDDGNGRKIFEVSYGPNVTFTIDVASGLVTMQNASLMGDNSNFYSSTFATSRASDSAVTVSATESALVRHYALESVYEEDIDIFAQDVFDYVYTHGTSVGNNEYTLAKSGYYNGSAFSSIRINADVPRSLNVKVEGHVSNGVLYMENNNDHALYTYVPVTTASYVNSTNLDAADPEYSKGYLVSQAFITALIAGTYSGNTAVPTNTSMRLSSGYLTVDDTTLTASNSNVVTFSLTTSGFSASDLNNSLVVSVGTFVTELRLAFTLEASMDGIKTKNVVPFDMATTYRVGTSAAPFEFHGNVNGDANGDDGAGHIVWGAVFN